MSDETNQQSTRLEIATAHLKTLPPHIRQRPTAQHLVWALGRIRELEPKRSEEHE